LCIISHLEFTTVLFILYWIGYYTKTGFNPDLPDPPQAETAGMPEL